MQPPAAREKEIFLAAMECRSPTECRRYVREACGADARLLESVETLLQHHRTPDDPATDPIRSAILREGLVRPPRVATYRPGMRIGRYRLLEEIGEGGCGIVLLALQEEPVRREVALKVTKPGMDTRAVIARFEAERQALALMNHPGIARVFDAGATEAGHPYFVMERVRGDRFTRFCEQHRVRTEERLELMIQVCRAVEHAHQKGIIHRDLKPSNIMVTLEDDRAVPKIIDFGVAKAIRSTGGPDGPTTQGGGVIGTPEYMSPEQLDPKGGDVDTRTDLYSLGVVLFELLTGTTPRRTEPDAGRNRHRPVQSRRPSEVLADQSREDLQARAARQQTDARGLLRRVRGDLDRIVQKALEPDRERRYASAGELAGDLRHFLNHEPISARPDGGVYQAWKFIRRHRLAVSFAAALATVLIVGSVLFGWQYLEKGWALDRAELAERQERMQRLRLQRLGEEERRLREIAVAQSESARRQIYWADMNLARQALSGHNLGRARALLERHRPGSGQVDLRNWEWRHLWQQCQSDARYTLGHLSNEVTTLALSATGRWAAAGERNGGITVWNLERRTPVKTFPGGFRTVAVFSPEGSLLAHDISARPGSGENRRGIELWDADQLKDIQWMPTGESVVGAWFSPRGDELLTVESDGTISRWNVATGQRTAHVRRSRANRFLGSLDVTRDLSHLAVDIGGGRFHIVDTVTGDEQFAAPSGFDSIRVLRFSPDGESLAIAGGFVNAEVSVWNLASQREGGRLTGHGAWVSSIEFSLDGKTILTASADQTIRLWDSATWQPRSVLRGHQLEVWSLALSANGATLLSGSKDGNVMVWDPSHESPAEGHQIVAERLKAWRFPEIPGVVLTLSDEGGVQRRSLSHLDSPAPSVQTASQLAEAIFSPDGGWLAAVNPSRQFMLWRLWVQGAEVVSTRLATSAIPVAFAPGSDRLITWHPDARVFRLSTVPDGNPITEWSGDLPRMPNPSGSVALSGDLLLTIDPQGVGRLRNFGSGISRSVDLHARQVSGIALSADGRQLATSSGSGVTDLWQMDPFTRVGELRGFLLGAHGAAFSPDGSRVAVCSSGREAMKLFDSGSQQEVLTLEAPGEMLRAPAFSPDGQWLGATASGGKLLIWSATTPAVPAMAAASATIP